MKASRREVKAEQCATLGKSCLNDTDTSGEYFRKRSSSGPRPVSHMRILKHRRDSRDGRKLISLVNNVMDRGVNFGGQHGVYFLPLKGEIIS